MRRHAALACQVAWLGLFLLAAVVASKPVVVRSEADPNNGTVNVVEEVKHMVSKALQAVEASAGAASQKLAAIDSKFPNLDADLSKARAELEDVQGSDKWDGLKWFEKAIFFLPPFGPLVGVAMMSANKDMIRNTEKTVNELENIVTLRQELVAATRVDSFERLSA